MPFMESGGYGDVATHGATYMIRDKDEVWTGAVDVGWDMNPWNDYQTAEPTHDDDPWSLARHVPNATQHTGSAAFVGERYGQTAQWQSACGIRFDAYLADANAMTAALGIAAAQKPDAAAWLDPCAFGDAYSEVLGFINKMVGSKDPINGLDFAEPGQAGYVPRNASWIFGGSDFRTKWPKFLNNTPTPGKPFVVGKWWKDREYRAYNGTWKQSVSNAEFCRSKMQPSYPCPPNAKMSGKCEKDVSNFWGSAEIAPHYPLSYYQKQFSSLRISCIGAVAMYEQANADLLKGKTIDGFCVAEIADQFVASPTLSGTADDLEQAVFVGEQNAAIAEENRKAAEQAMIDAMLGGTDDEGPSLALIGGGALVALGALYYFTTRKRG